MNRTATSHFDAARILLKFKNAGMTHAEVETQIGGHASTDDLAKMAQTFRSDNLRSEFIAWVAA